TSTWPPTTRGIASTSPWLRSSWSCTACPPRSPLSAIWASRNTPFLAGGPVRGAARRSFLSCRLFHDVTHGEESFNGRSRCVQPRFAGQARHERGRALGRPLFRRPFGGHVRAVRVHPLRLGARAL